MTNIPFQGAQTEKREPILTSNNPYEVLGLEPAAKQTEIKRAYFALIRTYPPETEADSFKLIRAAYEKIKSAKSRAETDTFLPQPAPPWQAPNLPLALDTAFYPSDVALLLKHWGDLGRTDFQDDFKEPSL